MKFIQLQISLLVSTLIIIITLSNAQYHTFVKAYGRPAEFTRVNDMIATTGDSESESESGGILLAGSGGGGSLGALVKVDSEYSLEWFSGLSVEVRSVVGGAEGYYVVGTWHSSGDDMCVANLSSVDGSIVWKKQIASGQLWPDKVVVENNAIYVGSRHREVTGTNYSLCVTKLDLDGNEEYSLLINADPVSKYVVGIGVMEDGGVILVGKSDSGPNEAKIVRISSQKKVVWSKALEYGGSWLSCDIRNGIVAFGFISLTRIHVVKLDYDGELLSPIRKIASSSSGYYLNSVRILEDGSVFLTGFLVDDAFVMKLNPSGTLVMHKMFYSSGVDKAMRVLETGEGGFLLAGTTDGFSTHDDMFLVKFPPLGTDGVSCNLTKNVDGAIFPVVSFTDATMNYFDKNYTFEETLLGFSPTADTSTVDPAAYEIANCEVSPDLYWTPDPSNEIGSECFGQFSYVVNATSHIGPVIYALDDDTSFEINEVTGEITSSVQLDVGSYDIRVFADTSNNVSIRWDITVTIIDSFPPVFNPVPPNRTIEYCTPLEFQLLASDCGPVTYSIDDIFNFEVDSTSGVVTNKTVLPDGIYSLVATSSDGNYQASSAFHIVVEDTIKPKWTTELEESVRISVLFQQLFYHDVSAYDTECSTITYSLSDVDNFVVNSLGLVTNRIVIPIGEYSLTVTASDGNNEIQQIIYVSIVPNWAEVTTTILFIVIGSLVGFLVFACAVVLIVVMCCVLLRLGKRVKKFSKIKDIDLILEEQEMEEKSDKKASFDINKDFFTISMKDVRILKKIGEGGGSAVVYLAEWNNQKVAYKCFKINDDLEEEKFKTFEKEVSLIASISFPYILVRQLSILTLCLLLVFPPFYTNIPKTFYGATVDKNRVGFIMEFCELGDLDSFLKNYKAENNKKYPFDEKIRMVREISASMSYIHSLGVMHRDLKLENILVDGKHHTKLMDFGLSKHLDNVDVTRTRRVGSSFYMAPETLSGKYDFSIDVYSFSIVCYIMFTENFSIYGGLSSFGIEKKVFQDSKFRPTFVGYDIDQKLKELVTKNWSANPDDRNTFKEINEKLKEFRPSTKQPIDYKKEYFIQKNKIKELEKELEKLRSNLKSSKKV